jgi:hypothetical protein
MDDRGLFITSQAIRRQLAAMPNELYLIRLIHRPTRRPFPGERLWTELLTGSLPQGGVTTSRASKTLVRVRLGPLSHANGNLQHSINQLLTGSLPQGGVTTSRASKTPLFCALIYHIDTGQK